MSESYDEIVGTATPPDPYDVNNAISRDCPECNAPAGVKCTSKMVRGCVVGSHARRVPCVKRLVSGGVPVDHTANR